jgi:hypothetical protein
MGWEHRSGGRALAWQAYGPAFNPCSYKIIIIIIII